MGEGQTEREREGERRRERGGGKEEEMAVTYTFIILQHTECAAVKDKSIIRNHYNYHTTAY